MLKQTLLSRFRILQTSFTNYYHLMITVHQKFCVALHWQLAQCCGSQQKCTFTRHVSYRLYCTVQRPDWLEAVRYESQCLDVKEGGGFST